MNISINYCKEELDYASKELRFFLEKYTNVTVLENADGAEKSIVLEVNDKLLAHHYYIKGNGNVLQIGGGNFSSVLCGVYEALADAGVFFEATGYNVPCSLDTNRLFALNKQVQPKFRLRGIRQHINFPMDISSYPLWDAKEYIRNLARMRYNAITFHSYPGQWHETNTNGQWDYAGHFFYGKVYPVPQEDILTASRIDNRKYWCIPEAEEIFEDKEKRSDYAKYWLNELMKTAKEIGFTITMSVEVTFDGDENIVKMLSALLKTYPLIDTIELISEECGGFRDMPDLNMENIKEFLVNTFDKDILDENGNIYGLPEFVPHQLGASAISVRRVIRALELRDLWLSGLTKEPEIRAGIYLTCPDTLRILRPILRDRLPQGMTMSLLPAHGALAVADNVEQTGTITQDWQNTMFYSWAEFDGNMFVQQMSTDGIEKLVNLAEGESAYGFCINHWRTSENNLAISYAAESAISAISTEKFYFEYAKKLGISNKEEFTNVCEKLAKLDTYNRDNLFNVGFCAVGCWLNWCRKGKAITPRFFPMEYQEYSIQKYQEIVNDLNDILLHTTTQAGVALLRLLINRCLTSILHIRSLLTLDKIAEIYDYDNPKLLTKAQLEEIDVILKKSRGYAEEYLVLYGEILPDRGCQGQLVSYYETMLVYIDAVAANFKDILVLYEDDYDAPPMPDAEVR